MKLIKQFTVPGLNGRVKNIGELWDDNSKYFYKKEVKLSKHLYRVTDEWGIDNHVLDYLPKGTIIQYYDTENSNLYSTTKEEFVLLGNFKHHKPKEDYLVQRFLARSFWVVTN